MTFNEFTRLFGRRRTRDDGSTVRAFWVCGEDEAALINPESGRVFAYVWDDGCGKYYPTVIVSPWRALHLITREASRLVSLLAFPRLTVELYRLKTDTLLEARLAIQQYINVSG